jgi:type II secretory pathway pseudopilin PulG
MRIGPRSQEAFSLVELIVAMFVLLVGMLGVATLVNTGDAQTGRTAAREGGTNLVREVLERARTVTYASLTPDASGHPAALTSLAGLQTAGGTGTWIVTDRRGVTYTLRADVCKIDDIADSVGGRDTTFCNLTTGSGGGPSGLPGSTSTQVYADLAALGLNVNVTLGGSAASIVCALLGANPSLNTTLGGLASLVANKADVQVCNATTGTQTTIDRNPDDFTRVTVTATWTKGKTESVVQSTLIPNPAASAQAT